MRIILILPVLMICTSAVAQDVMSEIPCYWPMTRSEFHEGQYPADSFSIKRTTYQMQDYYTQKREIAVVFLRHDYKLREPDKYRFANSLQFWIEQYVNGHLIRSICMDVNERDERLVFISDQFLPNYFAVLSLKEFTGELFLIDNSGAWYILPGYYFCLDEIAQSIYSFVPEECGGCRVGKFNLTTKEMITKESDGRESAWPEYPRVCYNTSIFEEEERVRWDIEE